MTERVRRVDALPVHPEEDNGSGDQQQQSPCPEMQQRKSDKNNNPRIETEKPGRSLGFTPVIPLAVHFGSVHDPRADLTDSCALGFCGYETIRCQHGRRLFKCPRVALEPSAAPFPGHAIQNEPRPFARRQ